MGRLSERRIPQVLRLLMQAGLEWYKSRTFELGAALAFYAIFSIAPVIVLAFTIASLVLGEEEARGQVAQEIESTVGHTVAVAIQATAQYAYRSGSGVSATVLSIVSLILRRSCCSARSSHESTPSTAVPPGNRKKTRCASNERGMPDGFRYSSQP